MQVGDHGGDREFPFEAERQVNHDADHHHRQRHQTVMRQLIAHLGSDEFHPLQGDVRVLRLQRSNHFFTLLGGVDAMLRRQANHHVLRGAEALYLGVGEAKAFNRIADVFDIGRFGVSHFHHRAAGEFDREVQAAAQQEKHCQHESQRRDDVEYQRVAHEGDIFFDAEKFHHIPFCTAPLLRTTWSGKGAWCRSVRYAYLTLTSALTSVLGFQIWPMARLVSVVTLESRMVAQARSKPILIAACGELPLRSSSRIRSLISTLESIAIPSASAIAAIPGKVSVACSVDSTAISSSTLTDKANALNKPNSW